MPDAPDPYDLERERKHTREVHRILYGRTQRLQEAASGAGVVLLVASIATGLAGLLNGTEVRLTGRAVVLALIITLGTILLILTMVVGIRIVQRHRSHLQPVRLALKEAYVKATYSQYSHAADSTSNHAT
jgi:hypothetical protein